MPKPKPGDRVRVEFEAVVIGSQEDPREAWCAVEIEHPAGGVTYLHQTKVLWWHCRPPYVPQVGDVVKHRSNSHGALYGVIESVNLLRGSSFPTYQVSSGPDYLTWTPDEFTFYSRPESVR